jgi:hypothetical protein
MTKLCARGKAAAKRKFKVYPSAYANAYAAKICAGKIKDPSGVKRKDFKGKKPSGSKVASAAKRVRTANKGAMMKKNKPIKAGKGMLMPLFGLAGMMKYMQMNKKKSGTVKPQKGQINPVTGEGMDQANTNNTNLSPTAQKGMQALKSMGKMGAKRGKLARKPRGAVLGLLGTAALMNHMNKRGKKKARQQAKDGEMQSLMAGNMPQDKSTSGLDSTETTGMSMGGMTPSASGSYIKQDIDGDESFTNPSTQAYYKGMLD